MIDQNEINVEAWDIIRKTTEEVATTEELRRLGELQDACECNRTENILDFTQGDERCQRCGRYV